jgi:hypothetical protein
MNISVKHRCLGAALALTALPHHAAAQQWVIESPAMPGGAFGAFATAESCEATLPQVQAEAAQNVAQADAALKSTPAQSANYGELLQSKIGAQQVAQGLASANCAQQ